MDTKAKIVSRISGDARHVLIFLAHVLVWGKIKSTLSIVERMKELGVEERGGHILWLRFPVLAPFSANARDIRVDFHIILRDGMEMLKGLRSGDSLRAVERAVEHGLEEANGAVYRCLTWGAYTKNATKHGKAFFDAHPEMFARVSSSTHGDAGTVALILEAMVRAGVSGHDRIALVGSNGVIGTGLARTLNYVMDAENLLLVGRPDKLGRHDRRDRLLRLADDVFQIGVSDVRIGQDMHSDLTKHRCNVIIVATNGSERLHPEDVPKGAVVFDVTAPPACHPDLGWAERNILVLTAGCGVFEKSEFLPEGFGIVNGEKVVDVGMGEHCIWGCTGEGIIRTMYGWNGHICGEEDFCKEVLWCSPRFREIGFAPQPPNMFGRVMSWRDVRHHVETHRRTRVLRPSVVAMRIK